MQDSYCVYILFCAISFVPPPIPPGTRNTQTVNGRKYTLPAGYMRARRMCAHVRYIHQVNREKTRCQLQNWSCLVGEGKPGSQLELQSRQCAFLKTLGRAGLGEWLFKTLGSFYFTTMEVNSALKCQSK